ncbi:MAG: hypothetical protein AABY49_04925 [Planctomycetota bacterium]
MPDILKEMAYFYKEVFWFKELFTILQSLVVFILVRWFVSLKHRVTLLLFLSAFVGGACNFFGDLGYWNDNDTLKHIAPASLYLIIKNKDLEFNVVLFAFLSPFFILSCEFYTSIVFAIACILSHLIIILFIFIAKKNVYLFLFISIIIGILYSYIGAIAAPATNDILVNPALITLSAKGIDFYTKNNKYNLFLKYFWTVLLCFAFLGNWIFCFISDYYKEFTF